MKEKTSNITKRKKEENIKTTRFTKLVKKYKGFFKKKKN